MAHARTENMKDPVAVGQMIAETAPLVVFDEDWLMHTGDHWKKTRLGSVSFKQFVNRFAVQLMGETPKKAKFAEIIHAMETAVEMPEAFEPVPGKIAFRNGVLDIASRKLEPHSPEFRNRHAMPFDFDPDIGDAVEWLKFLDTVWDGTPDLIEFLQLWIGYNLLDDTSQQRFVNLVGKTRSGKGTIAHVMTRLNGSANVVRHAFQAVGDRPARLLIFNAPGHMHDRFFTGIGQPLAEGQTELPEPGEPDIQSVLSIAESVGMTFVAPDEAPA